MFFWSIFSPFPEGEASGCLVRGPIVQVLTVRYTRLPPGVPMPHCADPGSAPDVGASNKINTAGCPLENSHPGRVLPVVPYIHPIDLGEIGIKYIS